MPLGQAVLTGVSPMSAGNIALFIIGMIAIIAAAYYVTYYLGSKSFKLRSGRNIVLRDRFAVSKDKSFFVLEIYGKVYIVGVTNHSMTVIDTLEAEDVPERQSAQRGGTGRGAPGQGGLRQRMTNSMADFIAARILKRGKDDAEGGDSDFGTVYNKALSEQDRENTEDAEDGE